MATVARKRDNSMLRNKAPQTIAAPTALAGTAPSGAVSPPIYLSSTFALQGFERARTIDYTRSGNPTRDVLADVATGLEG
jgi:cystathionine gamma-synthase